MLPVIFRSSKFFLDRIYTHFLGGSDGCYCEDLFIFFIINCWIQLNSLKELTSILTIFTFFYTVLDHIVITARTFYCLITILIINILPPLRHWQFLCADGADASLQASRKLNMLWLVTTKRCAWCFWSSRA